MKVLLISGEFPPLVGGVGDYTACLATALHNLGVQVSVLTSRRAEASPDAFPFPVLAWVPEWSFGSWGIICRAVAAGPDVGKGFKPGPTLPPHFAPMEDMVHIQYQAAAYGLHPAINLLPPYLQARAPGVRVLVTFHDLKVPYMFPKAGPLRGWAVRSLARRCHGVVCTDEGDLQAVSRWGLRAPVFLIPIGSNIPVVGASRRLAPTLWAGGSRPGDSFVLGYFGLLNQSKGVETLLQAHRLLRQRGLPVSLVMVGADLGDSDPSNVAYAQRVRSLVRELELEGAIRWTGYLSAVDTSRALRDLDLCVLPYLDGASFRRGTLMAALAHGLPIVTTTPAYTPGVGPRLADGENCRLAPPGDAEALARAIEELAGSPSLREKLGKGALDLAQSFTWEEIGRRTLEAYEEVLSRPR